MGQQGYILIARSIKDWSWADNPTMVYFWLHLLIMANWKDKEWHGIPIKRGSLVTTVADLARDLKLSVKQVRTCLDRLKNGKEISISTANNCTHITICKYDDYQAPTANEGQINGKCEGKSRATTKEEYNTSDTIVSSYSIQEEKKKERDTSVSPKKPQIDFGYIKRRWNESMTRKVPKVQAISESRKEKIRLRIEEMGGIELADAILTESFRKINDSEFCNGENDNKWVASFDWFFSNDKNWCKVIEGNYDNRQRKTELEKFAESIVKADEYFEQRYGSYGCASPYGVPPGGGNDGPDEQ